MRSTMAPIGRPPAFVYRRSGRAQMELCCERIPLSKLANRHGTPLYVYSANAIRERYRAFDAAFRRVSHTICYSVKANSNLALLRMLAGMGSGFDVVSGGELLRVLKAAKKASGKVVFSGVGKTTEEMDAALKAGILMFNVESEAEIAALAERAERLRKTARIALRVNPDVPAETHPYIATGLHQHKFGVPIGAAPRLYAFAAKQNFLSVEGVSVHIGSQITNVTPFGAAMERVAELVHELKSEGHNIRYVDAGGGLGISYTEPVTDDFPKRVRAYADAVTGPLRKLDVRLLLEPGRSIIGPAGALVVRVIYRKSNNGKSFLVVDGAMNDLIRPALYGAHHEIVPVAVPSHGDGSMIVADVVGPICETGDFFARDRNIPRVEQGDLLAILDAGAYGMSISSNYNTRCRAAEVLVAGTKASLVRRREVFEDMVRNERL